MNTPGKEKLCHLHQHTKIVFVVFIHKRFNSFIDYNSCWNNHKHQWGPFSVFHHRTLQSLSQSYPLQCGECTIKKEGSSTHQSLGVSVFKYCDFTRWHTTKKLSFYFLSKKLVKMIANFPPRLNKVIIEGHSFCFGWNMYSKCYRLVLHTW